MNINKKCMVIRHAVKRDEQAGSLRGIHFTPDYMVATDANILAVVTYPDQFKPEDVPEMIKTGNKEDIQSFTLLPCDITLPKGKSRVIPCLNDLYVDVESTNQNGQARLMSTDLKSTQDMKVDKIEGEFPDIERPLEVERGEPILSITFNAKLLGKLCDMVKEFSESKTYSPTPVRLDFYGSKKAVVFETVSDDQILKGCIMPMVF